MVLAANGSLARLAFGWTGTEVVAARAHQPVVFDGRSAELAVSSALVVNVAFSILPATRAAQLDPVSALKQE
jgi:ABC-type antimicrobial peptide transport system permease subunit